MDPFFGLVTCYCLFYIIGVLNANMRRKMITRQVVYNLGNVDYVGLFQGNEFLYLAPIISLHKRYPLKGKSKCVDMGLVNIE